MLVSMTLLLSGFGYWIAEYRVPESGWGGALLFFWTATLFPGAVVFVERGKWLVVLAPVLTMLTVVTLNQPLDRGWSDVRDTSLFWLFVLGVTACETLFFTHIRNVAIEHSRRDSRQ